MKRTTSSFIQRLLLHVITLIIGWIWGLATNTIILGSEPSIIPPVTPMRSLCPLERSSKTSQFSYALNRKNLTSVTDTVTPFHRYMTELSLPDSHHFPELPMFDSWLHYFEAYHNHMARFRKQPNVIFMEIGVQSGGKIPVLRKYFGPGFTYVGIDINPSTKMFETSEHDDFNVHIEIGDITDKNFLDTIKAKYPRVDIFLDDGGHTMEQQLFTIEHMLPHVQPQGIYMCEDLATSWLKKFGGLANEHILSSPKFLKQTMVGLVHQTMDWFLGASISGKSIITRPDLDEVPDDLFDITWWKVIPTQVKHIHYYNQIVVYEKGVTYKASPYRTVGKQIPYKDSGHHKQVNWSQIITKLDSIFGESRLL